MSGKMPVRVSEKMPAKDGRRLDLELMRVIACFFVIFNHTGENGFFRFSLCDSGSFRFWVYLAVSIFCKFSVPLFFMVSGALLLEREESLGRLWRHRIGKIALVLLAWSFFYYLDEVWLGWREFRLGDFAGQFLWGNWNLSFWYLYTYLAMLMTLPLLRKFAGSLTNREFVYLFSLAFVFSSLLPVLQYLLWQENHSFNSDFQLGWVCAQIFVCPLLGYFLRKRIPDFWSGRRLALLWAANLGGILVTAGLTVWKASLTGMLDENHSQSFYNLFAVLNAASVFAACTYLAGRGAALRRPLLRRLCALLQSMGSCTLGIYLLHLFFHQRLPFMGRLWDVFRVRLGLGDMISAFLYCGVIFLMGYGVTLVLKRVPLVRRLV